MNNYKVYTSQEYVENKIEESRVRPDWSQNDPTAVDYINGKTHWAEAVVNIEWDGDISGLRIEYQMSADGMGSYGPIPFDGSIDDLVGATVKMTDGKEYTITERGMNSDRTGLSIHSDNRPFVLAYTTTDSVYVPLATWTGDQYRYVGQTNHVETAGLYFWYNGQDDRVLSVKKEIIHALDEKFIPDSIARTEVIEDIANLQTELSNKAPSNHSHTIENISNLSLILNGKTDTGHKQAADTITTGTFDGPIYAKASAQAPGTSLLRNSKIVQTETNPSNNGEICWMYE